WRRWAGSPGCCRCPGTLACFGHRCGPMEAWCWSCGWSFDGRRRRRLGCAAHELLDRAPEHVSEPLPPVGGEPVLERDACRGVGGGGQDARGEIVGAASASSTDGALRVADAIDPGAG